MSTIVTRQTTGAGATTNKGSPLTSAEIDANFMNLNVDKLEANTKDASGGVPGLTLFKVNMRNVANTFTSWLTNSNTAPRTYTFKDADGTIAFVSDITGTNSGTNTGDNAVNSTSAPIAHVGAGGVAHANVVAGGAAGFMTGTDKTKLDGLITTNAGTLALSIGAVGATNTSVTIGTGTGFNANTASNLTYDIKVGPSLSALATLMATAGAGFIRRGAVADTYTIDTNTYLTAESDTLSSVTGRGATTATTLTLTNATASTTAATGALLVTGGVGIGGALNVTGNIASVGTLGFYRGVLTGANTVSRTYTFPDKDGTVAMTSDITGINSGTNTGDETVTTIKAKLGITTLSGSNTGDQDLSSYATKTGAETLSSKTIAFNSNTISGTLAQFNAALTDADFVSLSGTETLTSKTLTTPILTNPSYSGATANGGTVTTIDINGGTLDGVVIGGSVAAAGNFTTVSASSYTASSGYYINASTVLTPGATTQGTQFVTSSILQWACGSGGYSWNNNANSASLMSMTNAGAVTIPGSLSVNTVSTDVKAVVGSSVAKATTASTEVVWVKSSDTSNALTLAIGINSNATDTSRGAYLQAAEQGVAYRNLLIQPDGGNVQIGSPSGSGAVTIPGSVVVSGSSFSYTRASGSMFIDVTSGTNKSYFGWDISISGGPATAIESDGAFAISTGGAYTTSRFRIETTGAVTIPGNTGIGLANVGVSKLEVSKDNDTLLLSGATSGGGNTPGIAFRTNPNTPTSWTSAAIKAYDGGASYGAGLKFYVNPGTTAVAASTLAIDIAQTGAVTIPGSLSLTGGTFGYGTGAGGTVTQATSKSTAVTLNKPCGQITMHNAALAAGDSVAFQVINSVVNGGDTVIANVSGGVGYGPWYSLRVVYVYAGNFYLVLKNEDSSSHSEAVVFNFAVISGATS